MGKKRKFNRFIRWIKSDLPEDNKSVLLLGVTKIPSPTPAPRPRPHTLHLDHHLAAKSHTLDAQPRPRPRLFRSHSKDSLNELLTCRLAEVNRKPETNPAKLVTGNGTAKLNDDEHRLPPLTAESKIIETKKKVSFVTTNNNNQDLKKLGFCTEQPYDFYHPDLTIGGKVVQTNDVTVPDIVMDKSVDSIGSCSLDVDASSTDFSDSSIGSSDCTLRSLGVPTPSTNPSNPVVPTFRLDTTNGVSDAVEPKKPSYLNLACTVNGYSNITNYDSKLRENFRISRSREVSPIRPQDYHASVPEQSSDRAKFLTPNYSKPLITSPANMTESKSQTILRSSQSSSYSYSSSTTKTMSFVSQETRKFATSMLYNSDNDVVDNASFSQKTNGVQSKFVSSKMYSNVNGRTSSNIESSVQESYTNGQQNGQVNSKSFIQQRVERLYGPGALAQGFFISKRTKSRLSESENSEITTTSNGSTTNGTESQIFENFEYKEHDLKQSCSSPSLPVLRHLRPEFRAQLPILSPKRVANDNTIQKSTTVPSSLTAAAAANGLEENKLILNGSKTNNALLENKENIEKQIIDDTVVKQLASKIEDSVKIIPEEIPAAPQVILPIVAADVSLNGNDVTVNGSDCGRKVLDEVKDGHYFLKILKNETDRLIGLAEKVEAELEEKKTVLTDDVLGYLRSASGKARLLVTQKMQQFEGLCHKNINQIEGEPFPTTAEDLQGFWDMVMLQVTQVDQLFAELDTLKANNWIIEEKPIPDSTDSSSKPKKILVKKPMSANAEAQRKQREAARKKMIEERRKAMREKQTQPEQAIEIFVPESS